MKALKRVLEIPEENHEHEGKILSVLTLSPVREKGKESTVCLRAGGRLQSRETNVTQKRDDPWFFAHI